MEPIISRVYDLKIAGYDDAFAILQKITTAFKQMDETKRKTDEQLRKAVEVGNQAAIDKLTAKVKELETSLKSLDKQRQQSAKEVETLAKAEKLEAEAKLKNAQADRERTKSLIDQEKELDRQIDREDKANRKKKEATGYYYDLIKAQRAAIELYRQTQPDSPLYDQIKKGAIDAKAKVDAFNRSLSPDGTLVGEYRSGIVNAFKELGLTDIIKKQKDDINNQLKQLQNEARNLASQYRATGTAGEKAFKDIDIQLRQNFEEQEKLKRSLNNLTDQGIGTQISKGIGGAFKDIKREILQAGLAYVSFQAIINGAQNVFQSTVSLDSLNSALKVVSGSEEELAKNQEYLRETTERLGLEYISTGTAFKNFYAASTQAGIGADQTREIFSAAAAASARLKLSQDDTNGVLLAFSQIASKGKVQAEELRGQIGERVPGAFSIAARAIGVTQAELNKMLQNGEVIATEFLPKFAAELQKTFGGDANKKVDGLQANVNKLKNTFTELIANNSAGLTVLFNALIGFLTFLSGNLPIIIGLFTIWTLGWISLNREMLFNKTILPVLTFLFGGAERATRAWTLATQLLTRAKQTLAGALQNPYFRIFSTIIGGIVLAVAAFSRALADVNSQLSVTNQQQKFLAETNREATKQIQETITKENVLLGIIKDRTLADKTRKKALEELKSVMGEYGEALTLENVLTEKGTEAIKRFNEQLLQRAKISASAAIAQREASKLSTLLQYQEDIKTAQLTGGSIKTSLFDKDFLEKYYQQQGRSASQIGQFLADKVGIDFTYSGKDLDAFAKLVSKEIQSQTTKVQAAELNKIKIDSDQVKSGQAVQASVFERFAKLVKSGGTEEQFESLKKDIESQKKGYNILSKEYKDLVALEKQLDEFLNPKKDKPSSTSKLSGEQKDAFKDIDANRDTQLAEEKRKFLELKINEQEYLQAIYHINVEAADKKLALIKGKNAEERKVIAELKLYKIEQEEETRKKLFELAQKSVDQKFNQQKTVAENAFDVVNDNPQSTAVQKSQAREQYLAKLIVLQTVYNANMDALEKQFGKKSADNEEARKNILIKLVQQLRSVQILTAKERYEQEERIAKEADQVTRANIESQLSGRVLQILQSNASVSQQARQIKEAEVAAQKQLLQQEVNDSTAAYNRLENAAKNNLATQAQVAEARKRMEAAKLAYLQFTQNQEVTLLNGLKGLFNNLLSDFTRITDAIKDLMDGKSWADILKNFKSTTENMQDAIKQSAQTIRETVKSAIQSYYDLQRSQVDRDLALTNERIDIQEKQQLALAESESEKTAIQKKFDEQRKAEEKKAAEERKKIAIKQLTVEFAVGVAKSFQYGWPAMLLPIAALTAQYLLMRSLVSQQQFAGGGKVGSGPNNAQPVAGLPNGRITAAQNIPTQPNGDNILATVKRGEVILNEEQQKRLGGARTFARIGVPGFAEGGRVSDNLFTGMYDRSEFGAKLQAPVNPQAWLNLDAKQAVNRMAIHQVNDSVKELNTALKETARQIHQRIDNIKVTVSAKEVEETNNKTKKAKAIGTL
jgi:tape measure domain-containing protein